MLLTRRYFMEAFATSALGLALLGIPQKSVGFQEIDSSSDDGGLKETTKSEGMVPSFIVKSRFQDLPLLYDF